jgi:hypothetical protein
VTLTRRLALPVPVPVPVPVPRGPVWLRRPRAHVGGRPAAHPLERVELRLTQALPGDGQGVDPHQVNKPKLTAGYESLRRLCPACPASSPRRGESSGLEFGASDLRAPSRRSRRRRSPRRCSSDSSSWRWRHPPRASAARPADTVPVIMHQDSNPHIATRVSVLTVEAR